MHNLKSTKAFTSAVSFLQELRNALVLPQLVLADRTVFTCWLICQLSEDCATPNQWPGEQLKAFPGAGRQGTAGCIMNGVRESTSDKYEQRRKKQARP